MHVQPEHLNDEARHALARWHLLEAAPEPLGLPLPTELFRHLHAEHEQVGKGQALAKPSKLKLL